MDSRAEPRDPQIEGGQRVSPAAAMSGRTQNRDVPGRVGTGVAGRDDREQSGNGRPQTQIFTSKNTRDPTTHTHTTEHTMKHHSNIMHGLQCARSVCICPFGPCERTQVPTAHGISHISRTYA